MLSGSKSFCTHSKDVLFRCVLIVKLDGWVVATPAQFWLELWCDQQSRHFPRDTHPVLWHRPGVGRFSWVYCQGQLSSLQVCGWALEALEEGQCGVGQCWSEGTFLPWPQRPGPWGCSEVWRLRSESVVIEDRSLLFPPCLSSPPLCLMSVLKRKLLFI